MSSRSRIHFIELHDQPWFPHFLRQHITAFLSFFWSFAVPWQLGLAISQSDLVVEHILPALDKVKTRKMVDMCSGAGGPVLEVQSKLAQRGVETNWLLTDLYPNVDNWRSTFTKKNSAVTYNEQPVDALNCQVDGFRTFFNSFHHFTPKQAQRLLQDAVEKGQPIGIFEPTNNSFATIFATLPVLLFGIVVAALSLRPFSPSRFLWSLVLPLVPLAMLFDGTVSCLRTYSEAELKELSAFADPSGKYSWTYKQSRLAPWLPIYVTSFIGVPAQASPAAAKGKEKSEAAPSSTTKRRK